MLITLPTPGTQDSGGQSWPEYSAWRADCGLRRDDSFHRWHWILAANIEGTESEIRGMLTLVTVICLWIFSSNDKNELEQLRKRLTEAEMKNARLSHDVSLRRGTYRLKPWPYAKLNKEISELETLVESKVWFYFDVIMWCIWGCCCRSTARSDITSLMFLRLLTNSYIGRTWARAGTNKREAGAIPEKGFEGQHSVAWSTEPSLLDFRVTSWWRLRDMRKTRTWHFHLWSLKGADGHTPRELHQHFVRFVLWRLWTLWTRSRRLSTLVGRFLGFIHYVIYLTE